MKTATIQRRYGQYIMTAEFHKEQPDHDAPATEWARVKVEDLAAFRLPLMWSTNDLSWEAAHAALDLFSAIGYYDYAPTIKF